VLSRRLLHPSPLAVAAILSYTGFMNSSNIAGEIRGP